MPSAYCLVPSKTCDFEEKVSTIGKDDTNDVTLPIPHSYFKSILTENNRGKLEMWSFIIPNKKTNQPLKEYLVPTTRVEKYSGLFIWDRLVGTKIEKEKSKIRKMW